MVKTIITVNNIDPMTTIFLAFLPNKATNKISRKKKIWKPKTSIHLSYCLFLGRLKPTSAQTIPQIVANINGLDDGEITALIIMPNKFPKTKPTIAKIILIF